MIQRDASKIARNFAGVELEGLRLKEGQRVHPREDRQETVTSPNSLKMGTKSADIDLAVIVHDFHLRFYYPGVRNVTF